MTLAMFVQEFLIVEIVQHKDQNIQSVCTVSINIHYTTLTNSSFKSFRRVIEYFQQNKNE